MRRRGKCSEMIVEDGGGREGEKDGGREGGRGSEVIEHSSRTSATGVHIPHETRTCTCVHVDNYASRVHLHTGMHSSGW